MLLNKLTASSRSKNEDNKLITTIYGIPSQGYVGMKGYPVTLHVDNIRMHFTRLFIIFE